MTAATAAGAVFILFHGAAAAADVVAIGAEVVLMAAGATVIQGRVGSVILPHIRRRDLIAVAERTTRFAAMIARVVETVFDVVKLDRRFPAGQGMTFVTSDFSAVFAIVGTNMPARFNRRVIGRDMASSASAGLDIQVVELGAGEGRSNMAIMTITSSREVIARLALGIGTVMATAAHGGGGDKGMVEERRNPGASLMADAAVLVGVDVAGIFAGRDQQIDCGSACVRCFHCFAMAGVTALTSDLRLGVLKQGRFPTRGLMTNATVIAGDNMVERLAGSRCAIVTVGA